MEEALINFILTHENNDVAKLLLKQKEILGYPTTFVANQINGRRRAKEKLPTWYANRAIIYPPQQNLEQCSSEATAKFKVNLIIKAEDKLNPVGTIADLTGGFGVDSFFLSRIARQVFHIEPDPKLCEIARKSHELLGAHNLEYFEYAAETFLSHTTQKLDWIYLDPSRKANGKKTVRLSDCQPDVVALLPQLFSKSDNILIKTSPLLDLKEGIKYLPGTTKIFVVSVGNECKEVLLQLQKNWTQEPEIICTNLVHSREETFQFKFSEETETEPEFSEANEFLYEPNSSILKAGAFKSIAKAYGLFKISVNTHLYTSDKCELEFPGRIFKVLPTPLEREKNRSFNIISRNHPLTPDQIKKKFKLKDGGEKYVLAFSGRVKKFILMAERVK